MAGSLDGVATFIAKVWKLVEKPDYNKLICWSENGKTFNVVDQARFSKEILPLYFKHSNFTSFVRQLNLYGFRKVAKPDQGSLAKCMENESVEFWHMNFRRGHPELLYLVQRRSVTQRQVLSGSEESKSPQFSLVMNDIHQMKGRQEDIASVLDMLKQENSHLRRDVTVLKEKHTRQQRVLNKVIQFLVTMMYKNKVTGTRRRSARLALMDADNDSGSPGAKRLKTMDPDDPFLAELATQPFDLSYSVQSPGSEDFSVVNSLPNTPIKSDDGSPLLTPPTTIPPPFPTSMSGTATNLTQQQQPVVASSSLPVSTSVASSDNYGYPAVDDSTAAGDIAGQLMDGSLLIPPEIYQAISISPAPSSLVANPQPDNQLCLSGHLDHTQQGLDALPDMLSGHFSVDPMFLSNYLSSDHHGPDYNTIDTARLLESLANEDSTSILHENDLPLGSGNNSALVAVSQPSAIDDDDPASALQRLLQADTA